MKKRFRVLSLLAGLSTTVLAAGRQPWGVNGGSPVRRLLAACGTLLAVVTTLTSLALPASASSTTTPTPTPVYAPAGTTPAPITHWTATSGITPNGSAPLAANGDPCETVWVQKDGRSAINAIEVWFRTTTYWCWNWRTVTSHVTTPTGGVTKLGAAGGWQWDSSKTTGTFHCWTVAGFPGCSGNYEEEQGSFQECILKVGCISNFYPINQLWENSPYGTWSFA